MANGILHQFAQRLDRCISTSEKEAIRLLTKIIARFVTFDKALGLTRLLKECLVQSFISLRFF